MNMSCKHCSQKGKVRKNFTLLWEKELNSAPFSVAPYFNLLSRFGIWKEKEMTGLPGKNWIQKCHFGNFSILAKWQFWNYVWNSKKNFGRKTYFEVLWRWHLQTCPRIHQIQDLGKVLIWQLETFVRMKLWDIEHFPTDFDLRKRCDNKMNQISD